MTTEIKDIKNDLDKFKTNITNKFGELDTKITSNTNRLADVEKSQDFISTGFDKNKYVSENTMKLLTKLQNENQELNERIKKHEHFTSEEKAKMKMLNTSDLL